MCFVNGAAFAMNKTDRIIVQKPAVMQGAVTNINGSIITVKDTAGVEKRFELENAAGIKIGESVWCEGDCGRALKIGDRGIRVKRIVGDAQSR